jgi:hypothetical protein
MRIVVPVRFPRDDATQTEHQHNVSFYDIQMSTWLERALGEGDEEQTGKIRQLKTSIHDPLAWCFFRNQIIRDTGCYPLNVETKAHAKAVSIVIALESTVILSCVLCRNGDDQSGKNDRTGRSAMISHNGRLDELVGERRVEEVRVELTIIALWRCLQELELSTLEDSFIALSCIFTLCLFSSSQLRLEMGWHCHPVFDRHFLPQGSVLFPRYFSEF